MLKLHKTTAQRVTASWTSRWEKKNLPRIARSLPDWTTPDHLTLLGILAAGLIAVGYILSNAYRGALWISFVGLFLHWFGDSLDGTLARVRKIERERYGYYVDRTADAISTVVICTGLGLSPFVELWVALLMGMSYLLLQIFAEICAYTSGRFPLSFGRLGPTEARIGLALVTMVLVVWTPPNLAVFGSVVGAMNLVCCLIAAGLTSVFLVASTREALRLNAIDRAEGHPIHRVAESSHSPKERGSDSTESAITP